MKPALSVIFFTVSSGAGLGLAVWLLAMQLTGRVDASNRQFWLAFAVAALLVTAGLISSTLHLANRRNAWRAFARFRSSWLSREGVLAIALYPIAALHAWLSFRQADAARVTGLLLVDSLVRGDAALFAQSLSHIILPALVLSLPWCLAAAVLCERRWRTAAILAAAGQACLLVVLQARAAWLAAAVGAGVASLAPGPSTGTKG
jgi:DMSO reductase anchor subunit